jgi:hypothetical protein
MNYCDASELTKYVLQAYLDKVDELNPGSVDGHIAGVSAEISEALMQGGYVLPEEQNTSALLTRVCAVMAAYRSIGGITSVISTEASSGNEWIPLQRLNTRAEKDLDLVRAGKLDPFPTESSGGGISVKAPKPIFTGHLWDRF